MSNKKSIFLESDSSILEDNLRFVKVLTILTSLLPFLCFFPRTMGPSGNSTVFFLFQNDFEEEINTMFSQADANLAPLSTQQFKIVKPQPGE